MAHDFLGTFTKSQFERFIQFARAQLPHLPARYNHLDRERSRVGQVVFTFEAGTGVATAYTADTTTYVGKLLAAYEVLGGNPIRDLRTRLRSQPVYLVRGSEGTPAHSMSDGSVVGSSGLADAPSALLIQQAKGWLDDTMAQRFEKIERKIRRAMDYYDELTTEMDQIQTLQLAAEIEGSLEFIASEIQQLFTDTNFRAIFDDGGNDPDGKTAYAPFSEYDVDPSIDPAIPDRSPAERPQRQGSGYIGPGEKGTA